MGTTTFSVRLKETLRKRFLEHLDRYSYGGDQSQRFRVVILRLRARVRERFRECITCETSGALAKPGIQVCRPENAFCDAKNVANEKMLRTHG